MAKVRHNVVVEGLGGMLGKQLVFKKDKAGRTIISYRPTYDENRAFSPAQEAQQEAFREAVAYGKSAKDDTAYVDKSKGTTQSPFNVAVADYLHEPQILDIDISGWNGAVGQLIRVKAIDDVKVAQVTVVITDENGTVLEQGAAVAADGLWWQYTTTQAASGSPKVMVSVQDLPGHIAQMTK
ncbi:MAG: hypothetical protein WBW94_05625 [Anaerolineales bacterium]